MNGVNDEQYKRLNAPRNRYMQRESLREFEECEGNIPQKRFKLKFFGLIDLSVGILNFSVYCVSLEAPNVETSSLPALNNL